MSAVNGKENICYVIGAGEFGDDCPVPSPTDLVIAADGGYAACRERGIHPDLVIGDFDSLGYRPEGETLIALPVEKDDTDMRAAVMEGWRRGFRRFVLYGGAGGKRTSHTIANIQLLTEIAQRGGRGTMVGTNSRFHVIRGGIFPLDETKKGDLSVFSLSDRSEGVCIQGAKYELDNATLTNFFPLGVSNSYIGKSGSVSVREGCLLIIEEFP